MQISQKETEARTLYVSDNLDITENKLGNEYGEKKKNSVGTIHVYSRHRKSFILSIMISRSSSKIFSSEM